MTQGATPRAVGYNDTFPDRLEIAVAGLNQVEVSPEVIIAPTVMITLRYTPNLQWHIHMITVEKDGRLEQEMKGANWIRP